MDRLPLLQATNKKDVTHKTVTTRMKNNQVIQMNQANQTNQVILVKIYDKKYSILDININIKINIQTDKLKEKY
jgi:hypothetical protein